MDTGLGVLTPRISWYHQSETDFDVDTDNLTQGTTGLLSARLGLELGDGQTEIALWGTNLLDREYTDTGIPFYDGFAVGDVFFGPPRFFGVELSRRFE